MSLFLNKIDFSILVSFCAPEGVDSEYQGFRSQLALEVVENLKKHVIFTCILGTSPLAGANEVAQKSALYRSIRLGIPRRMSR